MNERCSAVPESDACDNPPAFYVEWQDGQEYKHITHMGAFACTKHTAMLRAGLPLAELDRVPRVTLVRSLAEHQRRVRFARLMAEDWNVPFEEVG